MSSKILAIAVLVYLSVTLKVGTASDDFVASWDINPSTHFYHLPQTTKAARKEGWTHILIHDQPKEITTLGFRGDPTFILLFYKGMVIGCQISFLVSDVKNSGQPLQYDKLDAIIVKTINRKQYYTATAFFKKDKTTGIRRIWFQEKNRLVEIPSNPSRVLSETPYLLKKCFPTMGIHYYTWHYTSDCALLYPWALLEIDGFIKGIVLQGFGTSSTRGCRKWLENIPVSGILAVIPDAPPCLLDAANTYGIISLHVWFVSNPQNITCNH